LKTRKSTAAAQGTAAHNLCEHKLKKALNIRKQKTWFSKFHDDEMEEHSDDYVAYVLEQIEEVKKSL